MPPKKKQKPTATTNPSSAACCIIPDFLYLGPVSCTSNLAYLRASKITHILSIGKSPTATDVENVTYLRLGLLDDVDADILPTVDKAVEFINAVKIKGGKVLVHCSAAISRSPTIVAAYLMKMENGVDLRTALEMLVQGRDSVAPNIGFLKQLGQIEMDVFGNSSIEFEGIEGKIRLKEVLKKTNAGASRGD